MTWRRGMEEGREAQEGEEMYIYNYD